MRRLAISAAALALASVVAAGADRGMHRGGGFSDGGFRHDPFFHHPFFVHHPFFARDHFFVRDHFFFRHPFVFHGFFRPFFFFDAPVFAPVLVTLYPPLPYPSYLYAPVEGYPGCCEYQTTTVINGQLSPAWGMGCLQPDGTWHTVN
jgi:hypothetical protein